MPGARLNPLLIALLAAAVTMLILLASSKVSGDQGKIEPVRVVRVEQLLRTASTTSGHQFTLPNNPSELLVSKYQIAAHATLPIHKHPFPRFGYVLSGTLLVTNRESGASKTFYPGNFIVEDVGTWHDARNLEAEPVRLLVIDLIAPKAANIIFR